MAFTNYKTHEINCKIVYFGARGCGKSANLRSIYEKTANETQGGTLSLVKESGPTPYFDFLPVSVGEVNGYHIKMHLYTIPSNPLLSQATSTMLHGIDGAIFVVDSSPSALAANFEAFRQMQSSIANAGVIFADLPQVVQFNKRDLPNAIESKILKREFNGVNRTELEAIASRSIGTLETLQAMTKLVVDRLSKS
jgi:signal recognition particle receptor subunit beta